MIRVLIADDQEVVRHGLAALLAYQSDLEVVGQAANGEEASLLAARLKPDVVLMDLRMPVCDGIEATRRVRGPDSPTRVLVLTTFEDDELVIRALQAGASGYLLKDTPSDQIAGAIRSVHQGHTLLGPVAATRLVAHLAPMRSSPSRINLEKVLTQREIEVLTLIGQGKNNKEIAGLLYITEGTVKNHVSHIFGQIGARDRIQAALIAQQEGLCQTS